VPTAIQSRAALVLITTTAVTQVTRLIGSLSGSPETQRTDLLNAVPDLLAYFTAGSAALAADFYDDERERASARGRFTAEPIVKDRAEKLARAIAWATEPLFDPTDTTVTQRLAPVVQLETARPYRDTITTNRQRDPQAAGWRRVTSGGCRFCRMLAGRGEVYRSNTARFASHANCHCTAQPVFKGDPGDEAGVLQYVASQRRRSKADQERLRSYLADMAD
jgi:hypothetical protein